MRRQKKQAKKIILGITGGYASGKTTVARILRSFGARVIDADAIAHRIIRPGTVVYKNIVAIFGRRALRKNMTIDRCKLARLVFDDKRLLRRLNSIMHPEIIKIIKDKIDTASSGLVVLDAPLLVEKSLQKIVDKVIVVKADRRQQIERSCGKRRLTKEQIIKRIKVQLPLFRKLRIADFIIDNSGTIRKTRKQVAAIRRLLWKN